MPHQNIAKVTCYKYIKIVPKEMILIHWEIPLRFMSTIFWNYKYLYFQPILVSSLSFTLSSEHTRRIWGVFERLFSQYLLLKIYFPWCKVSLTLNFAHLLTQSMHILTFPFFSFSLSYSRVSNKRTGPNKRTGGKM